MWWAQITEKVKADTTKPLWSSSQTTAANKKITNCDEGCLQTEKWGVAYFRDDFWESISKKGVFKLNPSG